MCAPSFSEIILTANKECDIIYKIELLIGAVNNRTERRDREPKSKLNICDLSVFCLKSNTVIPAGIGVYSRQAVSLNRFPADYNKEQYPRQYYEKAVDIISNKLVTIQGNETFTDSMIIANGTNNQHESVVRLIKEQKRRLEIFGKIDFSDLKSGKRGRPTRIYKLMEPQATLLITFLDNTDIVADFKTELVRQFYAMRQFIFERQTEGWIKTREQGKITRKAETDTLKGLVEYARKQGYDHSDKLLYMNYTKLANKICGISKRDNATIAQLSNLTVAENIILHCVQVGIEEEKYYKDIYQDCKKRLEMFKDIAYLEVA